ncbi:hypothetical protein PHET_04232 [Paragonimus heterotremus]|uniref:Uncharacterized protein n=1 Tax=Paragonimus heterotremus TaxID=100268 RepID=A0A8J4X0S4_9TREM|nr:hypothetical protein PHET_04232 [Paragonimus heterotremus]
MSDFTADGRSIPRRKAFPVDTEYSPPPPLQRMATASISASPQTKIAFLCNSPFASRWGVQWLNYISPCGSAARSPVKTNVVDTNALLLAIKDKMDLLHGKDSWR